jgi:hypothetical protein
VSTAILPPAGLICLPTALNVNDGFVASLLLLSARLAQRLANQRNPGSASTVKNEVRPTRVKITEKIFRDLA